MSIAVEWKISMAVEQEEREREMENNFKQVWLTILDAFEGFASSLATSIRSIWARIHTLINNNNNNIDAGALFFHGCLAVK